MKALLAFIIATLGACQMASQYTPVPANDPAQIPIIDDGDPPDASSVNPSIQALADKIAHIDTGNTVLHSDLATLNGAAGKKVFVTNDVSGWYWWNAGPLTADGEWIVATTAPSGGYWLHQAALGTAAKRIPVLGPTPTDSWATVTPAGKLNKGAVDHGYFVHDLGGTAGYSTNSTTGHVFDVLTDLGALNVGDIVRFEITAEAQITTSGVGDFIVWSEYSQDGGSTWTKILAALSQYRPPNSGASVPLPGLCFTRAVSHAGDFQIRLLGRVLSGSDTLNLEIDSWLAWVVRP